MGGRKERARWRAPSRREGELDLVQFLCSTSFEWIPSSKHAPLESVRRPISCSAPIALGRSRPPARLSTAPPSSSSRSIDERDAGTHQ